MAERSSSGRILAMILVGLGAFLLVIAILLPTYTLGKLRTTPLDLEVTTVAEGTGDILNSRALLAGNAQVDRDVPLVAQRFVTVEEPSNGDVMTLQSGQTVRRLDMEGDTGLVSAIVDRVTIDRKTAMPVSEEEFADRVSTIQTSADSPGVEIDNRAGLQYKFPFDVQQESYPYFDVNARENFPLEFVGEDEISGLQVYHFRQEIGPVDMSEADPSVPTYKLSLPASTWGVGEGDEPVTMTRWYNNVRDLWVDPVTGVVVKGQEHQDQYYAREADNPEVTVLDVVLPFDDETVEYQVGQAKDGQDTIALFGRTLPIVLGILGVILLIVGFVLGLRGGNGGNRRAATESGPAPAGPAAAAAAPAAGTKRDYTDDRTEVIPRTEVEPDPQTRDWTTDETQEIPRTDLRKPPTQE